MEQTQIPTEQDLRDLGFDAAANETRAKRELARKLRIAFEHFRVVEPQHIDRFNEELKRRSKLNKGKNQWGEIYQYDTLLFTPVGQYPGVPPKAVLDEVKKAKELNCFDEFEVATIQSVEVIPDPIVFGRIKGCAKKYFIAQWDDDVKIEDILRPEEG